MIAMILLEDSRQQAQKHEIKHAWFEQNGIEIRRTKLYVGDYTFPSNQSVCVDTKKDIQEIIGNICGKQHTRFREECERAMESGIKLYILIENEDGVRNLEDLQTWQNPRAKIHKWITTASGRRIKVMKYPGATPGKTLAKAMATMETKYGVTFCFTSPEEAGARIIELLTGG